MTKAIGRLFFTSQLCLMGGSALARAFGDDGLCDALMLLSLFFGGAAIGSSAYGRFHGEEGR